MFNIHVLFVFFNQVPNKQLLSVRLICVDRGRPASAPSAGDLAQCLQGHGLQPRHQRYYHRLRAHNGRQSEEGGSFVNRHPHEKIATEYKLHIPVFILSKTLFSRYKIYDIFHKSTQKRLLD